MTKNKQLKIKIETLYNTKNSKVGVILKYDDFEKIMDKLEDLHDLYGVYKRKSKNEQILSLEEVKAALLKNS